jgi:hypothetical protein
MRGSTPAHTGFNRLTRRIRTKVLIDTFVQWLRLHASGLIKNSWRGIDSELFPRACATRVLRTCGAFY